MSEPGPSPIDLIDPITAYQHSALIATAVETGVADAMAEGPLAVEGLVNRCGTDLRGTSALLAGLAAIGIAERDGELFSLTPKGAFLASSHAGSVAEIVRKEWFFYKAWAELPQAVADGHARMGSWRRRIEEEPETAEAFLRALDDLASLFGGELPGLAGLKGPARLLDVGGGSGSHAANLVAANPEIQATVLDLPGAKTVLDERHPELPFVAGDLDQPRFGRPDGEQWDVVLLSNILHDHPADRNRRYLQEAASLVAPGGSLLIYEWVIDPGLTSPASVAIFTPMMLVENEGGWTWTEEEIASWLSEAGLEPKPMRRGHGPIAAISAVKRG